MPRSGVLLTPATSGWPPHSLIPPPSLISIKRACFVFVIVVFSSPLPKGLCLLGFSLVYVSRPSCWFAFCLGVEIKKMSVRKVCVCVLLPEWAQARCDTNLNRPLWSGTAKLVNADLFIYLTIVLYLQIFHSIFQMGIDHHPFYWANNATNSTWSHIQKQTTVYVVAITWTKIYSNKNTRL